MVHLTASWFSRTPRPGKSDYAFRLRSFGSAGSGTSSSSDELELLLLLLLCKLQSERLPLLALQVGELLPQAAQGCPELHQVWEAEHSKKMAPAHSS